jgi:hypothetical protein
VQISPLWSNLVESLFRRQPFLAAYLIHFTWLLVMVTPNASKERSLLECVCDSYLFYSKSNFPHNAIMVKYMDQQGWSVLENVTVIEFDEVKDLQQSKTIRHLNPIWCCATSVFSRDFTYSTTRWAKIYLTSSIMMMLCLCLYNMILGVLWILWF